MRNKKLHILIPSIGRRSYLVSYLKLNKNIVVHVCNSIISPAFLVADYYFISPEIGSEKYINIILDYCTKNKIKLILPVFDLDAYVFSKFKHMFLEKSITIAVSNFEVVEMCNDKYLTYVFLKKNKLTTPYTTLSLFALLRKIFSFEIGFPIIIKPRFGMGSIGIQKANNLIELISLKYKSKIDISNSYIKTFQIWNSQSNQVIFQEYIKGIEYGLDIVNDSNGKFIDSVSKLKMEMRSGETFKSQVLDNVELRELSYNLSDKIKHIGLLDVDIICSKETYYIIDLNPRIGGGYPFSHLAGMKYLDVLDEIFLKNKPLRKFIITYNHIYQKDLSVVDLSKIILVEDQMISD